MNKAAAAETPSGYHWHHVLQKLGHYEAFSQYMAEQPLVRIIENAGRAEEWNSILEDTYAKAEEDVEERKKVIRGEATA